jgi:hypothetical protein
MAVLADATPSAQHLSDLHELNRAGRLTDGSVPLISWLKTAVRLAGPRSERSTFEVALTEAFASMAAASLQVVATVGPWQPREVRDAVRVLAFSPGGGAAAAALRRALEVRIASGEVMWLDPIEGSMTRSSLFRLLRREPIPHILHFFGQAGRDIDGRPTLRLNGTDGSDEDWIRVDLLAEELNARCRGPLRLVVLEASKGADPALFAAAAQILVKDGVDAVLAYLWPFGPEVAQACSEEFYRALTRDGQDRADVVHSLDEARRVLLTRFEGSIEVFSSALYVRGLDRALFVFPGREPVPPSLRDPDPPNKPMSPRVVRLFDGPFSLLIGDHDERSSHDELRDRFRKAFGEVRAPLCEDLPLSALAQDFGFRRGRTRLDGAFQVAFSVARTRSSLLDALARLACPGVHATLLRSPIFELALAERQPHRTLYVLHPAEKGITVQWREAGKDWVDLDVPPAAIDLENTMVVLRLYGGITATGIFTAPLLTEDDYLFGFPKLENVLQPALAATLLRSLRTRPALCLGLSLLAWDHRVARHRLFSRRPLPVDSLALLDPGDPYLHLLEEGEGLPGRGSLPVLELTEGLVAAFVDLAAKVRT